MTNKSVEEDSADSRSAKLAHAEKIAVSLLAKRDHAIGELSKKMAAKGVGQEDIDSVIGALKSKGYLDDQRFAEVYIRSYCNKGHGPIKIGYELAQLGLAESIVGAELNNTDIDWFNCARRAREKKFGLTAVESYKDKAKQMRFLYSRGFSNEHISYAMELDFELD